MKYLIIFSLVILGFYPMYGQTPLEFYQKKDYQALIKLETQATKLTAEELYMVGYAFFQLENDGKAVEFYDKAIAKGLNDGTVHFYKGLALRYSNQYDKALKEIEISLQKEPTNQEYMNEKGMVFYAQDQFDKALEVFEIAKNLPNTFPEPYYWIAKIHQGKKDFAKALSNYYQAIKYLSKESRYHFIALTNIAFLETNINKDHKKASRAYLAALLINNEDYEIHYNLLKSFNANKEYVRADSMFATLKVAFEKKLLPKEDIEIKSISVAQFEWNGQKAVIIRSFIDPKDVLDISYKVFLLDKVSNKVERRFVVEKTVQIGEKGLKHLLCEQDKKTGGHITYPYGWTTDNIPVADIQKAVIAVLDNKIKKAASSNFGDK